MIDERAEHGQQHLANLTVAFGRDVRRRYHPSLRGRHSIKRILRSVAYEQLGPQTSLQVCIDLGPVSL
jgi:aspartate oxidase